MKALVRRLLPAVVAGLAVAAVAAPRQAPRFGLQGLGPVTAGQALGRAEAALGEPLVAEPPRPGRAAASAPAAAGCHHRQAAGQPGVRYTVAGDVVTRVETRDPRWSTVSGVRVGDTLARVQQVYGRRLARTPHPYFDKGAVLSVYSPDRRFALVMEANDDGRLLTLRSGRLPEVTWLEGCA